MGVALFATMAVVAPFMTVLQGYPILTAGALLATRGVGTLIGMVVVGRTLKYVEPRYFVLTGLVIISTTLAEMIGFTTETSARTIAVIGLIQGFGFGLVFIPLNTVAFVTLPAHLRTDGTAMLTLVRNVGSSVGISIVIANLSRTTTLMHARFSEYVTPFNDALRAPDVARVLDLSTDVGRALADNLITQQAALVAYSNDFRLLMWLTIASMPFVFVLGRMHQDRPISRRTPALAVD
jgi:DHA2 family multidrug resistance protein